MKTKKILKLLPGVAMGSPVVCGVVFASSIPAAICIGTAGLLLVGGWHTVTKIGKKLILKHTKEIPSI
ncbi:hypothetical protein [Clostridium vincentii]|uniref:Uncharacterized protein n=1 Tax=Clostridium vincentii TaxID=52704 RepID=A0A2T0BDW4_9CLOT|nr:hypothetical protein [Clostridium vincentii]PRR81997.1 hypothetical protein CLVI_20620 [Clostridium vincentii]